MLTFSNDNDSAKLFYEYELLIVNVVLVNIYLCVCVCECIPKMLIIHDKMTEYHLFQILNVKLRICPHFQ